MIDKYTFVLINHIEAFHLFTSQSDHVQWAVHETTNQSLRSVLVGNDIVHPVVGGDILRSIA